MIDLYNGDCLEIMEQLINKGVKVDAIITDPPYEISSINGGGSVNNLKKLNISLKDLERDKIISGYDIKMFAEKSLSLYKEGINCIFWCNKKQIVDYFNIYVNALKCKFQIISWHKTNALPTYSNKYLSDTEFMLYFHKGKGKCFPKSYEDAKTYYVQPINHSDKKIWKHPTIKPLNILEATIRNITREEQTILDPFMGSGTTGVACKNLNRNFIGIELDNTYFNFAKQRIEEVSKNGIQFI